MELLIVLRLANQTASILREQLIYSQAQTEKTCALGSMPAAAARYQDGSRGMLMTQSTRSTARGPSLGLCTIHTAFPEGGNNGQPLEASGTIGCGHPVSWLQSKDPSLMRCVTCGQRDRKVPYPRSFSGGGRRRARRLVRHRNSPASSRPTRGGRLGEATQPLARFAMRWSREKVLLPILL